MKIIRGLEDKKERLIAELLLLEEKQQYFKAIKVIDDLLTLESGNLAYLYKKGLNCLKAGKVLEAEDLLQNCYKKSLNDPYLTLYLGHIYKAKGESLTASMFYKKFIEMNIEEVAMGYWALADLKDYEFSQDEFNQIIQVLESERKNKWHKCLLLFSVSRIYEQMQQFELAFTSMEKANSIVCHLRPFESVLFEELISSFISGYTSPRRSRLTKSQPIPIFIIGMPRSGTTLIEQVLASHSLVEATDELPYIERIALELEAAGGYVSKLRVLSQLNIQKYSKQYIEQVAPYFSVFPKYFIDKNPNNFIHIGLIKTLFPNAKIINVIRDPLDNALSVYKQYFNYGHDYSYSMNNIICYWSGYITMMKHWHKLYPGQIFNLSYECLVRNSEQEIRNLLKYCNLDFENECLNFYKSKRIVLTPSVSQVRQPINDKSIGSWEKYSSFLNGYLKSFKKLRNEVDELIKNTSVSANE